MRETYEARLRRLATMAGGVAGAELTEIADDFANREEFEYFEDDEWRYGSAGGSSKISNLAKFYGFAGEQDIESITPVTSIRIPHKVTDEEKAEFEAAMVEKRKERTEPCPEEGCSLKYNHSYKHRMEW